MSIREDITNPKAEAPNSTAGRTFMPKQNGDSKQVPSKKPLGGLGLLSLNAVFSLTARSETIKATLPSQVHRIMFLINGRRSVARILKSSPYSIERTMQVIRELHSLGAVEALNESVLLKKRPSSKAPLKKGLQRNGVATQSKSSQKVTPPSLKKKHLQDRQKSKMQKHGLFSGTLPKKDATQSRSQLKTTPLQPFDFDKKPLFVESNKANSLTEKSVVSGIFDEILNDKPAISRFAKIKAPSAVQKKFLRQGTAKQHAEASLSNFLSEAGTIKETANELSVFELTETLDFNEPGIQKEKKAEDSFMDLSMEDIEQIVVDSFMTPTASGLVQSVASSKTSAAVYTPLDESDIIGFEPDTLPEGEGVKSKLIVKEFNQKSVYKAKVAEDLKDEPSIIVDEDSLAPVDSGSPVGNELSKEAETVNSFSGEDFGTGNTDDLTDPSIDLDIEFEPAIKETKPQTRVQNAVGFAQNKNSVFTKTEEEFFEKADKKHKATDFNFEDLDKDSKLPLTFWERLKQKQS